MTEQVTCHEFTGVIWQCSTTESDLVLCPEGYCPTCGTKLLPDGTTQAMVPAEQRQAAQQAREPGAVRALPEKWRSEAAEREAKATKSDSFGGEAGHLSMAKIFYECAAELEAAIASVEPGEPTVSEFTQEQRDELRRLAEKLKAHHSDRGYCNGECREYAVAVGAISLLDSIRTTEQERDALEHVEPGERGFWPESEVVETLGKEHQPGEPTADELLDALRKVCRRVANISERLGKPHCTEQCPLSLDCEGPPDELGYEDEDCDQWCGEKIAAWICEPASAIIAQRGGEPTTDAASRTAESV